MHGGSEWARCRPESVIVFEATGSQPTVRGRRETDPKSRGLGSAPAGTDAPLGVSGAAVTTGGGGPQDCSRKEERARSAGARRNKRRWKTNPKHGVRPWRMQPHAPHHAGGIQGKRDHDVPRHYRAVGCDAYEDPSGYGHSILGRRVKVAVALK